MQQMEHFGFTSHTNTNKTKFYNITQSDWELIY